MNLASNSSRSGLASLLSACDDDASDHLLWVSQKGQVNLQPLVDAATAASFARASEGEVKFHLETFHRGDGYVGPAAAKDAIWINRLFSAIERSWTDKITGCIKSF
jgi:hypothetical protein